MNQSVEVAHRLLDQLPLDLQTTARRKETEAALSAYQPS